jgi:hypothetical protein
MAFFYGLNSSTSSSFFSSMLGSSSSSTSSSFYNSLGDYAALKNGSYAKLVKAYYAQQSDDSTKKTTSKTKTSTEDSTKDALSVSNALSSVTGTTTSSTTSVTSAEQKEAATIKTEANALKADASDLLTKGTKSVFKKVDVKDTTTGLTNKEYDTDKIYKAVKQFAEDYNSLLTTASKTTNASILQKNSAMVKNVSAYEKELNALGITIGSDNKLSVDEDTFKAANMSDAKDLFNGSSSLGSSVYQSASEIENLASSAASSDSLYNSDAVYASSLTGSLYNSYT